MEYFPENRGQYLYLRLTGPFDTRGLTFGFPLVLNGLKENKIEKLLVDARDVFGFCPIEERLFVNESLADLYLNFAKDGLKLKIAVAMNKTMFHPERIGEKIAKNRGLALKATEDIEEAYAWLEVTPPKTLTQQAEIIE